MPLFTSRVPRSLESKTRMLGFELPDLMLIFLYLSISNLIFGATRLKFIFVWIATLLLASLLYFVKRNRPDGFLQHWGEFYRTPGILTANQPDTEYQPYLSTYGDNSDAE